MKKTVAMISAVSALLAGPALALDLQSARSNGSVCETSAGYVQKTSGGADVEALVSDVNAARKAEYTRISKENGQGVEVVAKIAAGKINAGPKCP